jgi:hypothetical protein
MPLDIGLRLLDVIQETIDFICRRSESLVE